MSKPARRIDEILFPKSSLEMGDSTFGTLRGSFFSQKSGAEFTDDRRSEGDVYPILSILFIHVSSSW